MDTVAEPPGVEVRAMEPADVTAVVTIEREAFGSPWTAETFASLIGRPGLELLVMEQAGRGVVGYAVLWCILDQGELANMAVATEVRGRGLGRHLLAAVLEVARSRAIATVYLEVRASNERATELYRRFGFSEVGSRPDYYDRPREDARIMMLTLRP